jgi:hypothetical protein
VTDGAAKSRVGGRMLAVFLAVLFLAVIGSAVGYLVGREVHAQRVTSGPVGPDDGLPGSGPATSQPAAPTGRPTATPTGRPDASRSARLDGEHCPVAAEKETGTQLIQVLHVVTASSQLWICRDAAGDLYYQGLNGAGQTITLPHVRKNDDGSYLATNTDEKGTYRYTVSSSGLILEAPGEPPTPEPAVSTDAG